MWENNYFKSCTILIQCYICVPQQGLNMHYGNDIKVTTTSQNKLSLFPRQNLCDIFPRHHRKQIYTKVRKVSSRVITTVAHWLLTGALARVKGLGNINIPYCEISDPVISYCFLGQHLPCFKAYAREF